MKKQAFQVLFNPQNGGVDSLVLEQDPTAMNWFKETAGLPQNMETVSVTVAQDKCVAVYESKELQISVQRCLTSDGCLQETYRIQNKQDVDYYLMRGELGICMPFADQYDSAEVCMKSRCHAHIWCGGNTAYINALKMSNSVHNVGLVLTQGSLDCYSIRRDLSRLSNDRGVIVLHPSACRIAPQQSITLSWTLFSHRGTQDFYDFLQQQTDSLIVRADTFTVFADETIRFSCPKDVNVVFCNGEEIPFACNRNGTEVKYRPKSAGEYTFTLHYGQDKQTVARFFVSLPLHELVKRRVHFIAEHQQCRDDDSPLKGAYLVYDNREERQYYSLTNPNLNASRERIGMAILIAKYLQREPDEDLYRSLMDYDRFLRREWLDETTGEVFDGVRLTSLRKRLYNAPWVAVYMMETYLLTKQPERLEILTRIILRFYQDGGDHFYPNAVSILQLIQTLQQGDRNDLAGLLLEKYQKHISVLVQNGLDYPKHEVNYEQTIVAPAATLITEYCHIEDSQKNRNAAQQQIEILQRFNGQQPDYRLYETSIRHWDGYWFGKKRMFGDTFPHYWSALTGWAFSQYAELTGLSEYRQHAEANIRSCLCTFFPDGKASCAYLYPFSVNEQKGEYFDDFANDQDFALYYALQVL